MKSKVEQDRKRRELVHKFEKTRNRLKNIIHNQSLDNISRLKALKELQSLPRNSSPSRVKNRCLLTGRSRSVYRDFKISRIFLREKAVQGFLPGIKKASWLYSLEAFKRLNNPRFYSYLSDPSGDTYRILPKDRISK